LVIPLQFNHLDDFGIVFSRDRVIVYEFNTNILHFWYHFVIPIMNEITER
jgi:hypothetical protein